MTQPDDWTQDATDALGDLAYDKIVAERDSIKVKWQATWASLEVVTNDAVRFLARAEAAEADARECRAERARYGDMMTERLGQCENERDAVRAELVIARKAMDKVADQRDEARDEAAEYRSLVDRCRERNKELGAENERLRDALGRIDAIVSALGTDNSSQDARIVTIQHLGDDDDVSNV